MTVNMTKNVLRILKAGKGYVERGWTRGAGARDATGRSVPAYGPEAVKWCAYGGIRRAAAEQGASGKVFVQAEKTLVSTLPEERPFSGFCNISVWNDKKWRTQKQVVALYDKAIARLERTLGSLEAKP